MKEVIKEPEITLFGRKIVLPENSGDSSSGGAAVEFESCSEGDEEKQLLTEEEKAGKLSETNEEQKEQESSGAVAVAEEPQNPKTPSINEDTVSENNPKSENDQSDAATTNGQQKPLKKPDKILPCPRCNSADTKFCYYNNYNVNQPRHFCKSCQRYWTAGGTMRNVPVGAGRRKNKNSTSHCRHITLSEALDAFKPNGTVLSFGSDAEKQPPYGVRNGYHHNSCKNGDKNVDENGLQKPVAQNINGFAPPAPFVPLPFPVPAICPPLYPMPFYPNPYWNIPWMPCPSSALGKHSRNGELLKQNSEQSREGSESNNTESSIVVPKTLRIDDPEEAAKSSIWETLGIKYGSIRREGLFKALQPKVDEKKSMVSPSSVLQANPAALSRSITFQERA